MGNDAALTDITAARRDLETAHGLPNAHYTDPLVFEEEKHAILFSSWAGLAVTSEVPEPGDAKPITFLGLPLLLLRDRDGAVRVFQNVCRHRGMILVNEPRKIEGAIRCPYHSWCYSTKGALVSTPHVGGAGHNTHEAIVKDDLGLVEVRHHVWFNTVFVNIDGNADPFEVVHANLLERWGEFDQPMFAGGTESQLTLQVKSNWKLAVENFCESYHLPWVHPGLNSYSRLEDHYSIVERGHYSGQGVTAYQQLRGDTGKTFPDFKGLDDFWDAGAEYIVVYPNVLLGAQREHSFAIVLQPDALDQTTEQIHLFYAIPNTDEDLRKENAARWKVVFDEDVWAVEGLQAGRHAPGFDGGRFSPAMDGATHCFHDWIATKIDNYREGK